MRPAIRQRQTREWTLKVMTRPFPEESNLIKFMSAHLSDLYDAYHEAEQEDDYSLMDYCQGSIDTTHVYLLKSGVTPMEYEQYLEIVTAEWKRA